MGLTVNRRAAASPRNVSFPDTLRNIFLFFDETRNHGVLLAVDHLDSIYWYDIDQSERPLK